MKICTKCGIEFCYGNRKDNRTHWCLDCTRAYNRQRKNESYVRKTIGTPQERSGVNHTFFDTWTADSAYALGLIFTDGCIQKRCSWSISFINTERSLVEWLKNIWHSNCKITEVKRKCPSHAPAYLTGITSTHMGEKLISLGVLPRKSKVPCTLPIVSKEFHLDFIRGLIDGDGSVLLMKGKKCVGGQTLKVSFCDAWDSVCLSFQMMLKELGVQSKFTPRHKRLTGGGFQVASISVGGKQAENLCAMLYEDSTKFCHPRKRRTWETYVAMRKSHGGMVGEYIQKKRTTPNYPWLDQLGKINDRQLAIIAGMSFSRIGQLRAERGILPYEPSPMKTPKLKPWHSLVGTMLDIEVSKQARISSASVCGYRKKLGIPRFKLIPKKKFYSWLHLAGTMPDMQLAEVAGLSSGRVAAIRSSYDIPSYRSSMKEAA